MAIAHSEAHGLVETILAITKNETHADRTYGTVTKVDADGTAWVRLAGSDSETPCKRTSASVKAGDTVPVTVRDGVATIDGNYTSPATDDTMAKEAVRGASSASQIADQSRRMAESAISDAESAKSSAATASQAATEASVNARKTFSYLLDVEDSWAAIDQYRLDAEMTVAEIAEAADIAEAAATSAANSAHDANIAAVGALNDLADIEKVVGTVSWISEHSKESTDTAPQEGKAYYIRNSTTGKMTYVADTHSYAATQDTSPVSGKTYYTLDDGLYLEWIGTEFETGVTYYEQTGQKNPTTEGWYELDESVQNYIAAHVSLTGDGLWVTADANSERILVSTGSDTYSPGIHIISRGYEVASYGEDATIGKLDKAHIIIGTEYDRTTDSAVVTGKTYYTKGLYGDYTVVKEPSTSSIATYYEKTDRPRIGLWQGTQEVAYITNNELYIPRVVVVDGMRIGDWIWEKRSSGNLRLSWIGE